MHCDKIQVNVGNINIMEKGVIFAAITYQQIYRLARSMLLSTLLVARLK